MSKKLNRRQLRVLAFVWIGVVVLVGVCVFLGILAALSRQNRAADASPSATPAAAAQQVDQPTPLPDAGAGQPTPNIEPTLPPNQDPAFGYGIQTQLHVNTEGTITQIEQLGMNWVKTQIRWADLEPVQGQRNWEPLDAMFALTARHGIKVLASIVAAPDWARSVTADGLVGPPDDPQVFASYIGEFAQRYRGAVHAIEVWNEPNLSQRGWYTAGGLNAADYMKLLIPASQAIRAADPNMIIISAAPAPTGVDDGVIAVADFRFGFDEIEET